MTVSLPLTPMQLGMVYHQLTSPDAGYDIEQVVVELDETVDADLLQRAFRDALTQFPPFRSHVRTLASGDFDFFALDAFEVPIARRDDLDRSALEDWLENERREGFDIFASPPVRVTLMEHDAQSATCILTFHHLLCDGRNFPRILTDVFDRYDALRTGDSWEAKPVADSAPWYDWLSRHSTSAAVEFHRERLADLTLPGSTFLRPPGGSRRHRELTLSAERTRQLTESAQRDNTTLSTVVQAAWAILLGRNADTDDVVFGTTRAGRAGSVPDTDDMIGVFINTIAVRATLEGTTDSLVKSLRQQSLDGRPHERAPLGEVQQALGLSSPLFDTLLMFDHDLLDHAIHRDRDWPSRRFKLHERAPYPLVLYAYAEPTLHLRLAWDDAALSERRAVRCLEQIDAILAELVQTESTPLDSLRAMPDDEYELVTKTWQRDEEEVAAESIYEAFARMAAERPEDVALVAGGETVGYAALAVRVDALAGQLQQASIGSGDLVGICITRSTEMVVAILAVLRAGAAYVPLDPEYPPDRLRYCASDAGISLLLAERRFLRRFANQKVLSTDEFAGPGQPAGPAVSNSDGSDLAYVIYTSGSTGRPKGVRIQQRNVTNFFAAMDEHIEAGERRVWMAVTSLSFDISALELLWTLTRGFTVVLHGARNITGDQAASVSFSLFFFANQPDEAVDAPYRLVMESAKFADTHGFEAIYTPERHFHAFGGLYPNPSVMGAAIAAITNNLSIRAGSVVLPLHSPFRIAEEWALVDNLSGGRVGISFASGWQPNDFVLAPDNYENRHQIMADGIEEVRRLWRGESVTATNPRGDEIEITTLPRPIQAELPIWITTAGNPETWQQAGASGSNVLTHLLGQTPAEIGEKVAIYREARAAAGLDPDTGRVTIMLHTFVGPDTAEIRAIVREPMLNYLRGSASLVGQYADAWTAYKQREGQKQVESAALTELSESEMQSLLEFAFERYFETSALFGSPEKCSALIDVLVAEGVNEIACLVDFGVAPDLALDHLSYLNELRELMRSRDLATGPDLGRDIADHRPTHLQTTPSLARMLVMQAEAAGPFDSLEQVLIGGEALPFDLVADLYGVLPNAALMNMYGPTETTIWSSTAAVPRDVGDIRIGRPVRNTQCYVLDHRRRPVAIGSTGELYIGGAGVSPGYHAREELTAERFIDSPLSGGRLYRTGDLVRHEEDGGLSFLGRVDNQVKVRGHRIELDEIEFRMREHLDVSAAAVGIGTDSTGTSVLTGYFVSEQPLDSASLREFLRRSLPDFMLPNTLHAIDEIPLTPNGKVDRNALPEAHVLAVAEDEAFAENEAEERIAAIWQQVLGLERVSVNANFFDVGGHSILAVKMQVLLALEFERPIAVVDLFQHPTVASFAAFLSGSAGESPQGRASERKRAMTGRRRRRR